MKPVLEQSAKPLILRPWTPVSASFTEHLAVAIKAGELLSPDVQFLPKDQLYQTIRQQRELFEAMVQGNFAEFRTLNGVYLARAAGWIEKPFAGTTIELMKRIFLSALSQRNLVQAILSLSPDEQKIVFETVGAATTEKLQWEQLWNGINAVAGVASRLIGMGQRVLYTDPDVDIFAKIDLMCGPLPNSHATLCIQVKSRYFTRFLHAQGRYRSMSHFDSEQDYGILDDMTGALKGFHDEPPNDPYVPILVSVHPRHLKCEQSSEKDLLTEKLKLAVDYFSRDSERWLAPPTQTAQELPVFIKR